ncbi:uncharacterized protein LOC134252210 [Saccostrea cucullata]|uniref:uncharacterized protein LOC134252210 n=1 Tax=Saccostrea cuccullata TaxID=36930 RepID=UPI002ECFBCD4
MNQIPRLSEAVYVGLCREVGSPTEVRIRREVMDIDEVVNKPIYILRGLDRMLSGSKREGFRLRTSDMDWMLWPPDHKVICDLSQISLYRVPQHTVILIECDDLPPGFTRLNLITPSNDEIVRSSCVFMNGKVYISSALFRDTHGQSLNSWSGLSSVHHGPCSTNILGHVEADYAFCFQSHHWPTLAQPWIHRCRQEGWPSEFVLSKILSRGVHVVPIGSSPENGEEWRMSFSQAEQIRVYSMNHCQFLCYGLLKIFLKEVINMLNNATTLCSYFIKTIVFWVIQNDGSLIWTPNNLVFYFWKCFQLLLHWVHIGECPNFFIPQNNMFRVKVVGSAQSSLFSQLYDLYCKGISCLLLSQTLRPYLSKVILYRTIRVCTDEDSFISSTELEISFFKELETGVPIHSIEEFQVYLINIKNIIFGTLLPHQKVTVQYLTTDVLRSGAFLIQNKILPNKYRNKFYYKAYKILTLLLVSSTFGCVSDILYHAMYFYRARRYELSLSILQKARGRMSLQHVMYSTINVNKYRQCMAGLPLDKIIRIAVVKEIKLQNQNTYIDEVVLEQVISRKNGMPVLLIPPLVMLNMLFILNHHRLGDTVRSQQSLKDLQTLMLYDDCVNVPNDFRDISWQILGICQQICGDYFGALYCYQSSLRERPSHKIQDATLLRLSTLPRTEF